MASSLLPLALLLSLSFLASPFAIAKRVSIAAAKPIPVTWTTPTNKKPFPAIHASPNQPVTFTWNEKKVTHNLVKVFGLQGWEKCTCKGEAGQIIVGGTSGVKVATKTVYAPGKGKTDYYLSCVDSGSQCRRGQKVQIIAG